MSRRTVINFSRVELVEQLHEDKGVENERVVPVPVAEKAACCRVEVFVLQVQEDKKHGRLEDGLAQDHFPHIVADEGFGPSVRFPFQEFLARGLGRQSQRRQGVHDQIYPEHLDGGQRKTVEEEGADERNEQGHEIHRELELQELADVFVNASSPEHGADDRPEVVVQDHHVGGFLGNLGSAQSHRKTNVGGFECGGVVRSVPRNGHYFSLCFQPGFALLSESIIKIFFFRLSKQAIKNPPPHYFYKKNPPRAKRSEPTF